MAKARKTKYGTWQINVYLGRDANGKVMSKCITADTRKEAERKALLYSMHNVGENMALGEAVRKYIEISAPVLSPATVKEYKQTLRTKIEPHKISAVMLSNINSPKVQEWVSWMSKSLAPKTVKNCYGLLTATMSMYAPDTRIRVRLPRIEQVKTYCPTQDEVRRVLEITREDIELYRAVLLAIFGLRRGEIAALTADDIKGNTLYITKAVAVDENGTEVIKAPKTRSSTREVTLPSFVVEQMPAEGKLVNLSVTRITGKFQKMMEKSGLPHFRFHDLRHFSASLASALAISPATIQALGGWSSPVVMDKYYITSMDDFRSTEIARLNRFYEEHFRLNTN